MTRSKYTIDPDKGETDRQASDSSIGIVVCEGSTPNQSELVFQLKSGVPVTAGEIVSCESGSGDNILAKVTNIYSFNPYFSNPNFIQHFMREETSITDLYPTDNRIMARAKARVVASIRNQALRTIGMPANPGSPVHRAPRELIELGLGMSFAKNGLHIGCVAGRPDIEVNLDVNVMLAHHLAVLGATGMGKSYTNGVIVEELTAKGIPVVIIDPHGEYLTLAEEKLEKTKVNVFSAPTSKSETNHHVRIDLRTIGLDALCELVSATDAQADLLYLLQQKMHGDGDLNLDTRKPPDSSYITGSLTELARQYFSDKTVWALRRKFNVLFERGVFGVGIPPEQLANPFSLSIIDLSVDIDEKLQRVICASVLDTIFEGRKRKVIPPTFIIIEEAHIFAPQEEDVASKWAIRRIAREGRKFGVGIALTSQRIVGLDKDALSQCSSKITLRIDSRTDIDYIRPFLSFAYNDEIELLPTLERGTAILSGVACATPCIIRIRKRKTKHGGETPVFIS